MNMKMKMKQKMRKIGNMKTLKNLFNGFIFILSTTFFVWLLFFIIGFGATFGAATALKYFNFNINITAVESNK